MPQESLWISKCADALTPSERSSALRGTQTEPLGFGPCPAP